MLLNEGMTEHESVLGLPIDFAARISCEMKQQLLSVKWDDSAPLLNFVQEYQLLLSESQKKRSPHHVYIVYAVQMCAYSVVCLEISAINSGDR